MKKIKDPGFGYLSRKGAKSIINKKGGSNVLHRNRSFSINDIYSYIIQISWFQFFLFVFLSYIVVNSIFAIIYLLIGIEQITSPTGNLVDDFFNAFFFSAQTITTVGYGGISPQGFLGNIISTFQALVGLLSFSFITGLLYGRFSRPRAAVRFSKNIILRKFNNGNAIMFKLMNSRPNIMIDPEITVIFSLTDNKHSKDFKRNFYKLNLEMSKLKYLTTTWTVVHEIDEESPFNNLTNDEIKKLDAEWYVLIQYHDETFAQSVHQLHSYQTGDLLIDVKFKSSVHFDSNGYTVLDHHVLSEFEKLV